LSFGQVEASSALSVLNGLRAKLLTLLLDLNALLRLISAHYKLDKEQYPPLVMAEIDSFTIGTSLVAGMVAS
jgi:hypothetical protein